MPVALRSYDLINSVGVGAHIDEGSIATSSYSTSDVGAQLKYLGIGYVRTDSPYQNLAGYVALGQQGIKFELVTVKDHGHPVNLAREMKLIDSIAPYVSNVEGPNEVNADPLFYAGQNGSLAARQFQNDLYIAVHNDPALKGVGVLPFSLSQGYSITGYGDVSAQSDYGNAHAYASDGVPPYYMFPYILSSVTTTLNKPFVITETGYSTVFNGESGVDQSVQAKWLMDIVLENYAVRGVVRTFMYQLEDDATDPVTSLETHYGFFNTDGTPKQSAIDMHNLLAILKDTGPNAATFTAGSLNFNLDDSYDTGYNYHALFEKSSGVFDLALWSEPQYYNTTLNIENYVAPLTSTVSFGGYYDVSVYDPVLGVSAIATYHNVSQIDFTITTDPLIVEVSPVGTTPAVYAVVAPPLANGTTSTGTMTTGTMTTGTTTTGTTTTGATTTGATTTGATTTTTTTTGTTTTGTTTTGTTTTGTTTAPAPVSIGTGPNSITLGISEDAYLGDDQFNVFVDGTQIGGTQTATASHALGQDQQFTLNGAFSAGNHQVSVVFLNDLSGAGGDRTLYIDTTTIASVTSAVNFVMPWNGYKNFVVNVPAAPAITPVTLGTGSDSITVGMSEDAYKGDDQFTISVDGTQIGGIQTATASHALGQSQAYTLNGTFGSGKHAVTVAFLNDLSGPGGDRTLYIDTATVAGTTTVLNVVMPWTGTTSFFVTVPKTATTSFATTVLGSGGDSIGVSLSEDAYKGDAQFTLSVDGKQVGGTQTAIASHSLGQTALFMLNGTFGAGRHSVTVNFLNDLSGVGGDRTLYIDSATVAGTTIAENITMPWTGTSSFFVTLPSSNKAAVIADLSTATINPTTLASTPPTLDFIVASGATVVDSALAGGLPLTGTGAQNAFLLHAGDIDDTITNFNATTLTGDFIELAGYGTGASLTQLDAATWSATSASGSVHDLIHLTNSATLVPANTLFVS